MSRYKLQYIESYGVNHDDNIDSYTEAQVERAYGELVADSIRLEGLRNQTLHVRELIISESFRMNRSDELIFIQLEGAIGNAIAKILAFIGKIFKAIGNFFKMLFNKSSSSSGGVSKSISSSSSTCKTIETESIVNKDVLVKKITSLSKDGQIEVIKKDGIKTTVKTAEAVELIIKDKASVPGIISLVGKAVEINDMNIPAVLLVTGLLTSPGMLGMSFKAKDGSEVNPGFSDSDAEESDMIDGVFNLLATDEITAKELEAEVKKGLVKYSDFTAEVIDTQILQAIKAMVIDAKNEWPKDQGEDYIKEILTRSLEDLLKNINESKNINELTTKLLHVEKLKLEGENIKLYAIFLNVFLKQSSNNNKGNFTFQYNKYLKSIARSQSILDKKYKTITDSIEVGNKKMAQKLADPKTPPEVKAFIERMANVDLQHYVTFVNNYCTATASIGKSAMALALGFVSNSKKVTNTIDAETMKHIKKA